MSRLDLKIPPDFIWAVVAGLMWMTSLATAEFESAESFRRPLALILITIGIYLIIAARVALSRAGTTWHPTEPARTTALVTSGVYGFSRNPIYLGMEIVLLSWAVILASPAATLVSALFVAYIDRYQIRPEERTLFLSLGQDFRDYCGRVRRWI